VEPRLWGHVLWVKSEWEKVRSEAQDKFHVEQKASREHLTEEQAAGAAAERQERKKEAKQRKKEYLHSQKKHLHEAFCSRVANERATAN
ncbi:Hypothetical protein, putative, partial [Bodo saltans]